MKSLFKLFARIFKKKKSKSSSPNSVNNLEDEICIEDHGINHFDQSFWDYEGYARCSGFRTTRVKWTRNPFL